MKKIFVIALLGVLMLPLCSAAKPESLNLKPEKMAEFEIMPVDAPVVSLELAKKHLNVDADFTDDDTLIQSYIDGATEEAAAYIGRALTENRVYYPADYADFSFTAYANASVTEVKYAAINEDETVGYLTLAPENYMVRKLNQSTLELIFKPGALPLLPSGIEKPLQVYASTACPAGVVNGILLKVGKAYERREDNTFNVTDTAAQNAWRPYRLF